VVLAAYPVIAAGVFDSPLTLIAGLACGGLATGLLAGRAALLAWALAGLGCEYTAGLFARSAPLDLAAPLFAAALLVVGELAYFSLELGRTAAVQDPGLARRLFAIAGLGAAALAAGGIYEAAAMLPLLGGSAATVLGVVAAVAAVTVLVRVATAPER
jgi:hypothetical protein